MFPISAEFEEYLFKRSRTWLLKVDIAGSEYGTSVIVGLEIENSLVSGQEFEIGTAIVSKLTLQMRILDEVPANAKVVPSLALSFEGDATEWLPIGEFFIDSREKVNNVWTFVCYDKLMQANVPFISQLTYPTTQQAVWNEICTSLGYSYDSSVVINPTYTFQAGPAGFTKRQILGYIASANSASVYVGKDGKIKFRRFTAADPPAIDLQPSDYVRVRQTNPVKTFTRLVVTYDTEQDLTYEAGTGDENHTLQIENPFVTQEIVDDLLASLNGFSYMPIQMDARGYPQIEAGDRFSFARSESQSWQDTNIAWQDMELPWIGLVSYQSIALHTVYRFKGGLSMGIDAPSKTEQQSEFAVDGTLSGQINRLNQNAVKLGKAYYGATLTREAGFLVEREDHSSKVVLNSDELTFWAGGDKALWFDIPSNRFMFSGELVAATGTFGGIYTGQISANQINVTSGKITTAQIEDLIVGGNVSMGPSATISWNNVTGTKPATNADNTFDVIGANRLTHIGPTGIYTGTLTAAQVNAVNISASSIQSGSLNGINMTIGSGNSVFKADSSGIYLGNASFSSAPFRVSMSGALTATNATITGNITATSGTFTGTVNATSGTFTGTVNATSGTFTGTVNASGGTFSGTITGGTFVGGTFKSSNSGSRVELDTDGFSSFNSSGFDGVQIRSPLYAGDGGRLVFYRSGTKAASIYSLSSSLYIEPTLSDSIRIGKSGNTVHMLGNWDIQNNFTNWIASTSTSASSGSASALPATPQGYMTFRINGTDRKIPYYV